MEACWWITPGTSAPCMTLTNIYSDRIHHFVCIDVNLPIRILGLNNILHHSLPYSANFQGSKFSQITRFEDFVEIIHCTRTPHTHNILWVWHTGLAYLTHTITLSFTWARSCQQSKGYFEGISLERVPCWFDSLVPGCCPSMFLQSEHEKCACHASKGCIEIFSWIVETSQNSWN